MRLDRIRGIKYSMRGIGGLGGRIRDFARLTVAVRGACQGEPMNVEIVEGEYVPGPDGHPR
jgi:hypothetical protein